MPERLHLPTYGQLYGAMMCCAAWLIRLPAHDLVVRHVLCGCVDVGRPHAGTFGGARAATSGVCGFVRHWTPTQKRHPHRRSAVACQPAMRGEVLTMMTV